MTPTMPAKRCSGAYSEGFYRWAVGQCFRPSTRLYWGAWTNERNLYSHCFGTGSNIGAELRATGTPTCAAAEHAKTLPSRFVDIGRQRGGASSLNCFATAARCPIRPRILPKSPSSNVNHHHRRGARGRRILRKAKTVFYRLARIALARIPQFCE